MQFWLRCGALPRLEARRFKFGRGVIGFGVGPRGHPAFAITSTLPASAGGTLGASSTPIIMSRQCDEMISCPNCTRTGFCKRDRVHLMHCKPAGCSCTKEDIERAVVANRTDSPKPSLVARRGQLVPAYASK